MHTIDPTLLRTARDRAEALHSLLARHGDALVRRNVVADTGDTLGYGTVPSRSDHVKALASILASAWQSEHATPSGVGVDVGALLVEGEALAEVMSAAWRNAVELLQEAEALPAWRCESGFDGGEHDHREPRLYFRGEVEDGYCPACELLLAAWAPALRT